MIGILYIHLGIRKSVEGCNWVVGEGEIIGQGQIHVGLQISAIITAFRRHNTVGAYSDSELLYTCIYNGFSVQARGPWNGVAILYREFLIFIYLQQNPIDLSGLHVRAYFLRKECS